MPRSALLGASFWPLASQPSTTKRDSGLLAYPTTALPKCKRKGKKAGWPE